MNITLNGTPCHTDAATLTLLLAFGEAELLETGAAAWPNLPDNLPCRRKEGRTMFYNRLYRRNFFAHAVAAMAANHLDTGAIPEFMDEVLL